VSIDAGIMKARKQIAENTCFAGCSKTARCKAPEIPRSEAYREVRRDDQE
jgi:hypothetical protein